MNAGLFGKSIEESLNFFFREDDLQRNLLYNFKIPNDKVCCSLYAKSNLRLAGLPFFFEAFNYLLEDKLNYQKFLSAEGKDFEIQDGQKIKVFEFDLPFNVALTGERIALNLLQKSSSIATLTQKFVKKLENKDIKILDTRKTTPGLRSLEKYSVVIGGGFNHRLGQNDVWMIKDNHKSFFGSIEDALSFFENCNGFYTPVEIEVHDLTELEVVNKLNIKHIMLDNFTPDQIKEAIKIKKEGVTYEVSGGVNTNNIDQYIIEGVDAISIGQLTYGAGPVDLSFKYERYK
ncbi:MAG: carboxylating nicotinate-nucleotide diphosphorylase [Halobacteriovoraceae bacterium]|nr:carboxylating nicotinate-nucleotide diphosphorylase [Halobacteriovoraceae bacterium]